MKQEKLKTVVLTKGIDIERALDLSLKCFYFDNITDDIKSFWFHKWYNEPYSKLSKVFAVKLDNNEIVGCLRTISRTIFRSNIEYKVLGIAETFVNPENQGKGIAKLLTNQVIETSQKDYDLLFIVARKNIDNYYLKFNGFGLSSYTESSIVVNGLILKKYSVKNIEEKHFDEIDKIYNYSYQYCFGRFKRDRNYWNFLLKSCKFNGSKMYAVFDKSLLLGYLVLSSDNIILEIGANKNICYKQLLLNIKDKFKYEIKNSIFKVKVPVYHRIFKKDLRFDVSVKNRECYYGGHILKILDFKSVVKKAEQRLNLEYQSLGISPLNFGFESLKVIWDGKSSRILYPENHVPSYEESSFLLGIQKVYRQKLKISELGKIPFSISSLDEF